MPLAELLSAVDKYESNHRKASTHHPTQHPENVLSRVRAFKLVYADLGSGLARVGRPSICPREFSETKRGLARVSILSGEFSQRSVLAP